MRRHGEEGAVGVEARRDDATCALHAQFIGRGATFEAQPLGDAARTIAALLDFAAVGIENAVAEIHIGRAGFFHQQKLIEAHAGVAVCPLG